MIKVTLSVEGEETGEGDRGVQLGIVTSKLHASSSTQRLTTFNWKEAQSQDLFYKKNILQTCQKIIMRT